MVSFRRVIIAVGVITFVAQTQLAETRPISYQSILERLLDNQRVVNIVDDFLVFWDRAKDQGPSAQRRLWKRLVENKHRDYFDRAVYRTTDPITRRAMLDEFLIRVPSQVEAIREFNRSISDLPTSPLVETVILFKSRFREYHQQGALYIGLSMFRFDGAVRPVQNEEGIPDTLCLGAEVLAGYTREQIRIAISHEFFHMYHFGFLFKDADELSPAEFSTAHIPLMIEGMAAAGAQEVLPYDAQEMYLHFDKGELAAQQQDLAQNAGQFLELIREGAPPELYQRWFTQTHLGDAPPRGGYLLGYEVTKRVMATYGIGQMVRMTPAELREHSEEQLEAMANESILLMASH
jgi:Predicted Zn-dependent protease (DUF2268)